MNVALNGVWIKYVHGMDTKILNRAHTLNSLSFDFYLLFESLSTSS